MFLQLVDAGDGGAAGRADLILELRGMLACLLHHRRSATHRLRCER
jgi:hypothetical protein